MESQEAVGYQSSDVREGSVTSKDGNRIVFEKAGKGPAVIAVSGALAHRALYGDKALSKAKRI